MVKVHRLASILAAAMLLSAWQSAMAQNHRKEASSPAARRDELAKVQELLGDPDPLMRLSNMEAIVNSGDGLRIQIALRTALSGDDPALRGLATRAYIATTQQVDFDIKLPPAIQKQYDAAEGDQSKLAPILRNVEVREASAAGFHFRLVFKDYTISQSSGTVAAEGADAKFTVSGERFFTHIPTRFGGLGTICDVEFRPSRDLLLDGTLWCASFGTASPKLIISAAMF